MHILKLLALVCSFSGLCLFSASRPGIGGFRAPFITCCAIALALFFFAILGLLRIGALIVCATGIALLIQQALIAIKGKQRPVITIVGLVCCLPFVMLFFSISSNFKFTIWDEFSFWASSTKIIYTTNALFDQNSPIFFKTYPPIQQLFHYYTLRFVGWSEKTVLYAQGFWLLSGLLCIAGSLVKKRAYACLAFIASCSLPIYFGYSYASIYSDALLGVTFAACLSLAISATLPFSYWRLIAFSICAAALVLIKEIAIVLVAIASAVLLLRLFLFNSSDSLSKVAPTKTVSRVKVCLGIALAVSVAIIGTLKSWAWYVRQIDSTRQLSLPSMSDLSQAAWQSRISQTASEFWTRLFKEGYLQTSDFFATVRPSIVWMIAILCALSVAYLFRSDRTQRRSDGLIALTIFMGAVGYAAILFATYLFIFTEYEGVRLASFERYFSTYLLAWALVLFACWTNAISMIGSPVLRRSVAALGLLLILVASPRQFYLEARSIRSEGPNQQLRESIEHFAEQVKRHMSPGEKVYFIAQNTNGFERVMFYYAMLPYTSSMEWCWSLGKKYAESDVWTCDTGLAGQLKGYDYLAVYKGDKQFWDHAGALFTSEAKDFSSGVFKVIRKSDQSIEQIERLN
jgi:hypothetical protein